MKITGIILTKDGNIRKTKDSLSFCDEILIIKNENIEDFSEIRNCAMEKARNNWVFFLDDDETASPLLAKEIFAQNEDYDGFYIKRGDVLWGKEVKHGEIGALKLLRLAKKAKGVWKRRVHEYWDIKGKVGVLENPIMHYPHQTLREFVRNVNNFSSLHAKENLEEGKKSSLVKIVLWPKLKFIYNFFFELGFLDSMQGFIIALMMSFHSFLAWSELWLMQKKRK